MEQVDIDQVQSSVKKTHRVTKYGDMWQMEEKIGNYLITKPDI